MKVTYIVHSSVMIEFQDRTLLFDYYEGPLPEFNRQLPIYVFASHCHQDHFSMKVLEDLKDCANVHYIFSKDIKKSKGTMIRNYLQQIGQELPCYLAPNTQVQVDDMTVETLMSTDAGVAFWIKAGGQCIYHSGDLQWWDWPGEPEVDNANMARHYKEYLKPIQGKPIDLAFVVLDPRQEESYCLGFDYFMRHVGADKVVPIHMWEHYEWIDKLKADPIALPYRDKIVTVHSRQEVLAV